MEFFATFWSWLNDTLDAYIGTYTHRVAEALEPTIVTLGTIYVMLWGYLHLIGKIDEPFVTGLKRIAILALVFGAGIHLWLYDDIIVDTFYRAPAELAAGVIGAADPVTVVDSIWSKGSTVAENLLARTGWTSGWGFGVAAFLVWFLMGALCIYTMFLIALSKVGLSVLLALGPLFIVALLFQASSRYFTSWITQLANYALISILTVMVSALFLQIVEQYAAATAAKGAAILTVDALDVVLVSMLAMLFMMQITQIAATLAGGGIGLNTHGFVRSAVRAGWGATTGAAALGGSALLRAGRFGKGLLSEYRAKPRADWNPGSSGRGQATPRLLAPRNKIERVN